MTNSIQSIYIYGCCDFKYNWQRVPEGYICVGAEKRSAAAGFSLFLHIIRQVFVASTRGRRASQIESNHGVNTLCGRNVACGQHRSDLLWFWGSYSGFGAVLPANIHHFTDQICDVWSYRGRGETLQTGDAGGCIDIVSPHVMSSERTRGGRRCRCIYSDFWAFWYWNIQILTVLQNSRYGVQTTKSQKATHTRQNTNQWKHFRDLLHRLQCPQESGKI